MRVEQVIISQADFTVISAHKYSCGTQMPFPTESTTIQLASKKNSLVLSAPFSMNDNVCDASSWIAIYSYTLDTL
jgi:hypothetical protein